MDQSPKFLRRFRKFTKRLNCLNPLFEAKRKWPGRFAMSAFDAKAEIGGLRNPGAFQCAKLSRNDALS